MTIGRAACRRTTGPDRSGVSTADGFEKTMSDLWPSAYVDLASFTAAPAELPAAPR